MKILILTDHKTFEPSDSTYKMSYWLDNNPDIDLYIASRSNERNKDFFLGNDLTTIQVKKYDEEFKYENSETWFSDLEEFKISEFGGIFLRLDQPLGENFLMSLNKLGDDILIINSVSGLLNTRKKEYLINFPQFVPGIQIVKTVDEIMILADKKDIVLKPYEGNKGKGLIKIKNKQLSFEENDSIPIRSERAIDYLQDILPCVVMDYMENIDKGDKRIVVFNSQILGAVLRIPKKGSWLANVSKGATVHPTDITDEEKEIVSVVSDNLLKQGVLFFGIDTLENSNGIRILSEINIENTGGLVNIEKITGKEIVKSLMSDIAKIYLNYR